jgi:hypothetical protein
MRRKILVKTSGRKFCANPLIGPVTVTYRTPDMGIISTPMRVTAAKAEQGKEVEI